MATVITLKVKTDEGYNKVQHEVEEVTGFQFTKVMKVLKGVMKEANENEELKELLDSLFEGDGEMDLESLGENPEAVLKNADDEFLKKLAGSFDFLLDTVPEKAYEILSIMSGVKVDLLKAQNIHTTLDIYDAVLEANDVEAIINRVKKSLGVTKMKMKFLQKVKEATQK